MAANTAQPGNRAQRRAAARGKPVIQDKQHEQWREKSRRAYQRKTAAATKATPVQTLPPPPLMPGSESLTSGGADSQAYQPYTAYGPEMMPPPEPDLTPPPPDFPPLDHIAPTKPGDKGLVLGLASLYGLFGVGLYPVNPYGATVLLDRSQPLAESLVNVSHHHKRMREVLEFLVSSNDYVVAAMLHAGVLMAFAASYGLIPPAMLKPFGVPPPPNAPGGMPQWQQPSPSMSPGTGDIPSPPLGSMPVSPMQPPAYEPSPTPGSPPSPLPPELEAELEAQLEGVPEATAAQIRAQVYQQARLQRLEPAPPQGSNGYDPDDTTLRPNQNPAWIGMMQRRA